MECWWQLLLGLWAVQPPRAGHELLNVCLKAQPHKGRPGPEDKLYQECLPWRENACSTANTLGSPPRRARLYNFILTHCGLMTLRCQKHFIQATCLYECSLNLRPWIQPVDGNGPAERMLDVPLCREGCEQWWADCRMSYTCKSSWQEGWDWTRGKSRCPAGAPSRPFPHYFPTSADLYGKVWSNSFKAIAEHRGSGWCVQKWFDPARGSPNVAVARLFARPARAWGLS